MDGSRFDTVTRLFAERRLTRRQAMMQGGAGLMTAGVAAAGLAGLTSAQEATPVQTGASDQKKIEFLFLQSFQSGAIVPKAGEAGTWTLTLEQGLGQTVYFSDRPERIVGVGPSDKFLEGLGFSPDNPPNAALLFENDKGEEDISVVELFNPTYDTATHTATYEIQLLKEYAGLGMTFQEQPTEPPDAQATFGAAHLFIDDCADGAVTCISGDSRYPCPGPDGSCGSSGQIGYCFNWTTFGCLPCDPYGNESPSLEKVQRHWNGWCNAIFFDCHTDIGCTANLGSHLIIE